MSLNIGVTKKTQQVVGKSIFSNVNERIYNLIFVPQFTGFLQADADPYSGGKKQKKGHCGT